MPLEMRGGLAQICYVELRGALGTYTIPGPMTSLWELTLTGAVVSDIRFPPLSRAQEDRPFRRPARLHFHSP